MDQHKSSVEELVKPQASTIQDLQNRNDLMQVELRDLQSRVSLLEKVFLFIDFHKLFEELPQLDKKDRPEVEPECEKSSAKAMVYCR